MVFYYKTGEKKYIGKLKANDDLKIERRYEFSEYFRGSSLNKFQLSISMINLQGGIYFVSDSELDMYTMFKIRNYEGYLDRLDSTYSDDSNRS